MNRLLSHFALVILGVTPVFVASVALASTLTLDGLIRTEARQVVGYQIDSDLSHLFSGPGGSRTLHTEVPCLGPA